MKYHRNTAILACAGLFALSTTLSAQFSYNIELTGDEEVPPVDTDGSGTAFGSLDVDTNLLTWDVTFEDLSSGFTAAHFHGPADVGENAGILVDMEPPAAVIGETEGAWTGQATVSNEIRDHILDHRTYINLHSEDHGPGELRGQVVPEPGTYALFAGIIAFAGVIFWRRRRAKQAG